MLKEDKPSRSKWKIDKQFQEIYCVAMVINKLFVSKTSLKELSRFFILGHLEGKVVDPRKSAPKVEEGMRPKSSTASREKQ